MSKATQADLDAANAEVRGLMDQIAILKDGQHREALAVEAEYAALVANLCVIVRHVADVAATVAGKASKGLRQ